MEKPGEWCDMAVRSDLRIARLVFLLAFAAVVAVSCSSSDEPEAAPEPTQATTSTSVTSTSTTIPATTTSPPPTVTTTSPATTATIQSLTTTTTLAGVPYSGSGPRAGDLVAVVGVAFDDVLNVREGPGLRYKTTRTLEPTAADIPVNGQARLLPTSIWYEITTGGHTGWVSGAFIGLFGATDDATLEVYAMLGSPIGDDDLAALGATIANAFLSDEGGGWIALVEPSEGGSPTAVSSIAYDVVGLSDDAIKGYRLVIHASQDVDDGPYTLHSVERTHICWRGVDADGLCV
jgi:hypothetical protein